MGFFNLQDVLELVEGVDGFGVEALEVEEGHGGVEHFDVVSLDEFLADFEGVVFLAFGGLEVHGAHEEDRGPDAACDEDLLHQSDRHASVLSAIKIL